MTSAAPRLSSGGSLRLQLLWWLAPSFLLALLVSTSVCYLVALSFATRAFDTDLLDTARSLSRRVRIDQDREPVLDLSPGLKETLQSDLYEGVYFRVLSLSGATVAGHPGVPTPRTWPGGKSPVHYFDSTMGTKPVRVAALSVLADTGDPRALVLVAEELEERQELAEELLVTVLIPQLLLALVVVILLRFGVQRALVPLQRIARTIKQRGWNDLSPVGEENVPDEVRPLTQSVNDLMWRLDMALLSQQRFIADAAHQLRTPLAGLMAQLDRALHVREGEAIQPALYQLQSSARRATRLVNQMLTLSRAEPGGELTRDFKPLDLSRLVRQTCAEWVPEALAQGVDLGFEGHENPVMVHGDSLLLRDMLGNLIDNAIRYGRRHGTVTVSLEISPVLRLSVRDNGPGIPEAELERIFERFHRVPGSPPGGCGLGLAIVREIAHAHGAQVLVEQIDHSGSIFHVVFGPGPRHPR